MARYFGARQAAAGFTAIELLAVMAIMAILAAAAYPGFAGQLRQARRAEAIADLLAWEQAQGRWRSSHPHYASSPAELFAGSPPHAPMRPTASGRYVLSIPQSSESGYLMIASALAEQARDAPCQHLGVRLEAGTVSYHSGATSALENGPAETRRCWRQ